ncbi:HipA N-terminal domain-containing protein [Thiospirochaeta perfilievii]|nr:HipA N-terminal domain-containing protein [Thiospirochaeta perfilievii]
MDRIGYVYFNNYLAGTLINTKEGFCFTYDSDYIIFGAPIGYNFPFSKSKYYSIDLFPFFENLVSEGWLLDLQSNMQHIDKEDKFGILLNNGKDLIGAITIIKDKV